MSEPLPSAAQAAGPAPPPHPRSEALALARAAAAELRRARHRGRRRLALPLELSPAAPPQRAAAQPSAAVQSSAAGRSSAAAPARRANPAAPQTSALAELRARAAACAELGTLAAGVAACTACELSRSRRQTVFGSGEPRARLMFVGEAPGAEEDASGLPFVGRAGALLTDIITKGMGLRREDVYIANTLKCRPPGNRDPLPHEKELCSAWLERQIELIDPLVLIPLGAHAACHVLGVSAPISRLRGRVHERAGRKVVPTFHPAYLLRSPEFKRDCWRDIQLAMAELGLQPPGAAGNRSGSSG